MNVFGYAMGAFGGSVGAIIAFMGSGGYLALLLLVIMECTAILPSEFITPAAGFLASRGVFSLPIAFLIILLGDVIGMTVDYAIGYLLGKEVVYKHLQRLRVKRSRLDAFDAWFQKNGMFAVFLARLIPEVRALMSFPAGFAKMDLRKFYMAGILGSAIWDYVLILFGYYALGQATGVLLIIFIAVFVLGLYLAYRLGMSHIRRHSQKR